MERMVIKENVVSGVPVVQKENAERVG